MSSRSFIFIFGLALLPLFYLPYAPIPYEVPKVWLTLVWIGLLALLHIVAWWRCRIGSEAEKDSQLIQSRSQQLLLFFLSMYALALVCASVLGTSFEKSLIGNAYRIDGLLTQGALILFALLVGQLFRPRIAPVLLRAVSLSALVLSVWTVLSAVLLHLFHFDWIPNWSGAIGASFGQPNFLAGYLLVVLPWTWATWKKKTWQRVIFVGLQVLAIAATHSLGALGGVVVWGSLVAIRSLFPHKHLSPFSLLAVSAAILLFWSVALFKDPTGFQPESRQRIFSMLSQAARERPLLGWGVTHVDTAFRTIVSRDDRNFQHDVYLDKAHSELLEVLVTTGIIGVVIYLALVGAVLVRLRETMHDDLWWTLFCSFGLFLYHAQTNVLSISEVLIFWFVVGAALSHPSSEGCEQ